MSMSTSSSSVACSSSGTSEWSESESAPVTDTVVPSLLSRLKQAPLSAVNRKRKVAQNLPHNGKRRKPPRCLNEPKSVTPEQRVKEFPEEKLFCTACREELALKKSIIELHIKSEKHARGKERRASKDKQEQGIVKALNAYDEENTSGWRNTAYRAACFPGEGNEHVLKGRGAPQQVTYFSRPL